MSDERKMSFIDHLEELRRRLIRCLVAVLVGMIACWFFREQILSFLLQPLYDAWQQVDGLPEPQPLNFTGLLEPFIAYLKLSALGGLFVGAPVILYQLWAFIAPGLYPKERRLALPFVLVSTLLFVGGSLVSYYVVFPIGFRFFLDFAAGVEMTTLEAEVTVVGPAEDDPAPPATAAAVSPPLPASPDAAPGDAGVADGGAPDGGPPDAGPPVTDVEEVPPDADAGPAPARAPPVAAPVEEQAWWEWLAARLFGGDCGELTATPREDGAELRLRWHFARCGEPPELSTVTRDESPLELTWKAGQEEGPEHRVLTAVDGAAAPGPHRYRLQVPASPGAHRLAPVLMVKDFLSLAVRLILAFGLIFELPILISFLSIAGIVNYRQLLRFSRWFFVIAVVVGAMLTPPDVITQLLLALPLMVLYFASILVAYIFGPKPSDDD